MPVGLHDLGVHLLLWGGALLLVFALLTDWLRQRVPSRRRRRCPKCWYDLSHTPGLCCSECGFEAKRERRLFKAKCRWWWATFGVFLVLSSYALRVTPDVQDRGWVAAAPTPALIIALPQLEDPRAPTAPAYVMLGQPRQLTIRQQLYVELIRERAIAGDLPRWQKRWLAARAARTTQWNGSSNPGRGIYQNYHYAPRDNRDTSGRALNAILVGERGVMTDEEIRAWRFDRLWHRIIPDLIEMRDTWPESELLQLRISHTSFIPHNRGLLMTVAPCDKPDHVIFPKRHLIGFTGLNGYFPGEGDTVSFGRITADSDSICLLVSIIRREGETFYRTMHQPPTDIFKDPANPADVVYSRRVILPVRLGSDPHEIVQPVTCPAFEEQLRSQILLSSALRIHGQMRLGAFRGQLLKMCETEPITLAVIFEIRRENDIIYHGEAVFSPSSAGNVLHGASAYIPLDGDYVALDQHADDDATWTVQVRGDAALALRDPTATHYWQGEVIIPLEEVLARSRSDWWTNNPLEP